MAVRFPDAILTREVLLPLFVLGLVGVGLGTTTFGAFEDQDLASANPVQSGTLDLNLDGADSQTSLLSLTDAAPGDASTLNLTLTNQGSLSANHVELGVSFTANDSGLTEPGDTDLDAELNANETASLVRVTAFTYEADDGSVIRDVLSNVNDTNGNGIVDLQDVQQEAPSIDDLPAPQANGANVTYVTLSVEIASDADSTPFVVNGNTAGNLTGVDEDVMADGIDVTLTVTLNQDASQ